MSNVVKLKKRNPQSVNPLHPQSNARQTRVKQLGWLCYTIQGLHENLEAQLSRNANCLTDVERREVGNLQADLRRYAHAFARRVHAPKEGSFIPRRTRVR